MNTALGIVGGTVAIVALIAGLTVAGVNADTLTNERDIACIEAGGTTSFGACTL